MVVKELQQIYVELERKQKRLNSLESKIDKLYLDILELGNRIDESKRIQRIYFEKMNLLNILNREKKELEFSLNEFSQKLSNSYEARMKYQTHDLLQLGNVLAYFVSSYSGISYDFQQCKLAFEENKFLPIFLLVRANTNLLNDTFLAVVDEKERIHSKILQSLYQEGKVIPLPIQKKIGCSKMDLVEYQILNREQEPSDLYVPSMNYYECSKKVSGLEKIISDFLIKVFLYKVKVRKNVLSEEELYDIANLFLKELQPETGLKRIWSKKK